MKDTFPRPGVMAPPYQNLLSRIQRSTCVWVNPSALLTPEYTSVFLIGCTQNLEARGSLEEDLATAAAARGLSTRRSLDFCPCNFSPESGPTREELLGKVRAAGCDAIFTIAMLNVKSKERYAPGTGAYCPYPLYSFYGNFDVYLQHLLEETSSPGYYSTGQTYFLEGDVFDARTGEIQWSMQSIDCDPADFSAFTKEFALLLVDQLFRTMERRP